MNAMTDPSTEADEALTGPIVIALREARLVVERILLLSPVPAGLVPDVRDTVLYSQMLGLGGFAALLDGYASLDVLPLLRVEDDRILCQERHAWVVAPSIADVAVEVASDGGGMLRIIGARAPEELAVISGLAARHGVVASVSAPMADAVAITVAPISGPRPTSRMDALMWRMVRDGFPVLGTLWWRLYHLSNQALSPDSVVSRRHAGHLIVREDGSVIGRRDVDDDTDLRMFAAP